MASSSCCSSPLCEADGDEHVASRCMSTETSKLSVATIWKISSVPEGGPSSVTGASGATARKALREQCRQRWPQRQKWLGLLLSNGLRSVWHLLSAAPSKWLRHACYLSSAALLSCCIPSAVATTGEEVVAKEMSGHAVDAQVEFDRQRQQHGNGHVGGRSYLTSMGIRHEEYILVIAVLAWLGILFAVLWIVLRLCLTRDEVYLAWHRFRFKSKVCTLVGFSYYNVLMDWMQLMCFFRLGFYSFGLINSLILVLPPLVTFAFFSFVLESESKWTAPLYILQKHVLDCARDSWTKGIVSFTLVWAVAFEACFEAMPSSLLGIYAVVAAPEIFIFADFKIPAFLVCGPMIHPVVVTAFSVVMGVISVAKVFSKDLDYYAYGRLELKKNEPVMAYRWLERARSPEPELGSFRYAKDYCACVVYSDEKEEEIPISWLRDVPAPEGISIGRYIFRFVYRTAEVTTSIMTIACFSLLCRRQEEHERDKFHLMLSFWPALVFVFDFAINYCMVVTCQQTWKFGVIFAAMFTVLSPPLMLPQFDSMQLPHVATRFFRLLAMFCIVLWKNGWSEILRRTAELPMLQPFVAGSTFMYLVLAPLQLYVETDHRKMHPRFHRQYTRMTAFSTIDRTSRVPRVLRAALLDGNSYLVRMFAQFLPLEGALVYALEQGASREVIHELLDLQVDIPAGALTTATEGDAEHAVIVRLLKAGGTLEELAAPLRHALSRGASADEVTELIDAGAEMYKEVFETVLESAASHQNNFSPQNHSWQAKYTRLHPVFVTLLERGAAPSATPLRAALEHRCTDQEVLELLRAGAEVYDGVLEDAADLQGGPDGTSHQVMLTLLQHGGRPLEFPLAHALQNQRSVGQISELLDAGAQLYDGVLQTAVSHKASHSVMTMLLKLGGTPRDVALSAQLKRAGGKELEIQELLQARAEVYDGILKTAGDFGASYNTVLMLLMHGGTPRDAPLRRAIGQKGASHEIMTLLSAGAEVYDGVMADACHNAADHKVVLELLKRGGVPKHLPLPRALERGASLAEVRELIEAGAEKTEKLLQAAVDNEATLDVLRELVQTRVDLVCEQEYPAVAKQDMTLPLSRYWINSSHNTYLHGNQVHAGASAEQYIEVLRRGCRCVEIDVWNGTSWYGNQPMVTHGYAFCEKIPLKEVLETLKEHAFDYTDYPLILSLEMHCRAAQRRTCRKLFVEVLGDTLLYPPADESEGLVSPEQARGKIILKSKVSQFKGDDNEDTKTRLSTVGESSRGSSEATSSAAKIKASSDTETPALSRASGSSAYRSSSAPPRSTPPEDRDGSDGRGYTESSDNATDSDDAPSLDEVPVHEREEVPPDWLSLEFNFLSEATARTVSSGDPAYTLDFSARDLSLPTGSPSQADPNSEESKPFTGSTNAVIEAESSKKTWQRRVLLRAMHGGAHILERNLKKMESWTSIRYADCIYMPSCKFREHHITGADSRATSASSLRQSGATRARKVREISSFGPSKMAALTTKFRGDLTDYHERSLSRVYPPGHHIYSQNFDPTVHWAHGVQMVALNFQTFDRNLLLNEAFFRYQNGSVGFVLKPFSSQIEYSKEEYLCLRVHLVSSHLFPPTLQDTQISSVCVSIALCGGHGREGDATEYTTENVELGNGNARYDKSFEFNMSHADSAILTFTVFSWSRPSSAKQELVKSAYPVRCLRMGTRFVPLWDLKHAPLPLCGLVTEISLTPTAPLEKAGSTPLTERSSAHRMTRSVFRKYTSHHKQS